MKQIHVCQAPMLPGSVQFLEAERTLLLLIHLTSLKGWGHFFLSVRGEGKGKHNDLS